MPRKKFKKIVFISKTASVPGCDLRDNTFGIDELIEFLTESKKNGKTTVSLYYADEDSTPTAREMNMYDGGVYLEVR